MNNRPINFSKHALKQMYLRDANRNEVEITIMTGRPAPAKKGKFHSKCKFEYNKISPHNNKAYVYKTLDVIFADEEQGITIITVKVYFHNT